MINVYPTFLVCEHQVTDATPTKCVFRAKFTPPIKEKYCFAIRAEDHRGNPNLLTLNFGLSFPVEVSFKDNISVVVHAVVPLQTFQTPYRLRASLNVTPQKDPPHQLTWLQHEFRLCQNSATEDDEAVVLLHVGLASESSDNHDPNIKYEYQREINRVLFERLLRFLDIATVLRLGAVSRELREFISTPAAWGLADYGQSDPVFNWWFSSCQENVNDPELFGRYINAGLLQADLRKFPLVKVTSSEHTWQFGNAQGHSFGLSHGQGRKITALIDPVFLVGLFRQLSPFAILAEIPDLLTAQEGNSAATMRPRVSSTETAGAALSARSNSVPS